MKAVVQRVSKAELYIDKQLYSSISKGIVVLAAIKEGDGEKEIESMSEKLLNLRIFSDENDKMNLSVKDIEGEILMVSNFTVYGDTKKGRRPSYIESAKPEYAEKTYDMLIEALRGKKANVKTGVFRAMMDVRIHNDGPVTLIVEV